MVVDVFEQWFDSTDRPKWHQWEDVFDTYLSERGVERQLANRHVPRHPTFDTVYFYNWLRILPDNTVSRLCTTENLYREFSDIVSRVYQLLEGDVEGDLESSYSMYRESDGNPVSDEERRSGIEAYLCTQIGGHLRGDVNFEELRAGEYEAPESHLIEPPDGPVSIEVRSRNGHNFEDVAIFSLEEGFFEAEFGDSTLMFDKLRRSTVEPDRVIDSLAFDWEGNSWVRSPPPTEAITACSTDPKGRVDYYRIKNPLAIYGDSWGDLTAMYEAESEFERENPDSGEISHIHHDRFDWTLSTGMRY